MNHQTRKLHAQTGLNMLKEAVLCVLSQTRGMQRHEIIDALGLSLSAGAGTSGEVMTGVLRLLEEEKRTECRPDRKWYRCGLATGWQVSGGTFMDIFDSLRESLDVIFRLVGIGCGLMVFLVMFRLWTVLGLLRLTLERLQFYAPMLKDTIESIRSFCEFIRQQP